MTTMQLAGTDLTVSRAVLGMMRIAELDDAQIRALVGAAVEAGINVFDHADIYGGSPHACERRFGESGALGSLPRDQVVIVSKAGIRPGYYDFSREHLVTRVEGSLTALGTDHLDILLLHRPDLLMEPAEVAAAFDELADAGKVRHFGVSNFTVGQLELLRREVRQPLVVNQLQLSVVHAHLLSTGALANVVAPESTQAEGIVDYCRLHEITLQAWAPIQGPGGVFLDDPAYPELTAELADLATTYGVTRDAIAAAWIWRHPARMQVILGSTNPARIASAAAGQSVELTREEWYRLYRAAGHRLP